MTPKSEDEAREILGVTASTPYVTVTAQGIVIASGYSEALARLLRWVPKATWRTDQRAWVVPLAGADAVHSVLPEIIRLAEAAAEERYEERAAATGANDPFGKEWRAALSQATTRGCDDITVLVGTSAEANADRNDIDNLVGALRSEAAKLIGAADRLEAWLARAQVLSDRKDSSNRKDSSDRKENAPNQ